MNFLPWYQFAASLDAIGEPSFASSHAPDFWQKILCQSTQSTSSSELNIGFPDITARRDLSQGLVPGSSIQSSLDVLQDGRFQMIGAFMHTRRDGSANNIQAAILNTLPVLPENTENDLRNTTQSPTMQISKLFMFLLSNNHFSDSINDFLGIKGSSGLDEIVLGLLRACKSVQRMQLLSHGGPTSEALFEKIFQSALRAQDVEVCRILLDYGVDPNKQGFILVDTPIQSTDTPIQSAARKGNIAIATLLMDAGADVNGCLESAMLFGHTGMVNLLLAKGAHANTEDGAKALDNAVSGGYIVQAQNLISAGADVAWVYEGGLTALYGALHNPEMVNLLLQAGADVNAVTDFDIPILEEFVRYGSTDAIRSLLDARPKVFGNAVYFAVDNGDLEMLQILLTAGADVNACFQDSRRTALTRAVEEQSVSIVNFLLESGADVNGCTLAHHAHDSLEDSDLFFWKAAEYDYNTTIDCTPLQAASFHPDTEIAKILIEAGAEVNMDSSARNLSEGFITKFVEDEGHPVFYGTAVQIAARQGNMALIRLLCHAGADVNAPAFRWGGRTALQAAVESGNYSVIGYLLAAGADVNAAAAEKGGITALAAATVSQDRNILSSMCEEGASFRETSAGDYAVTALAAATANRDVRFVRRLLHAGANQADSAALQAAVANDDIELVRILLQAQAYSNVYRSRNYGYMALYTATLGARHELVEILLASEIDPSMQFSEATGLMSYVPRQRKWVYDFQSPTRPPWSVALKSKDLHLVRIFLEAGADPNQLFRNDLYYGFNENIGPRSNCLLFATAQRQLPLMQMLLEAGAHVDVDPDPTNRPFNTTLGYAAYHGQTDSVRLLLRAGANPNVPAIGWYRYTALQAAAMHGHEDVVEILLQAGADIKAPPCPYGGVTALQAAAIKGYLRLARVLIEAGADVNAVAAEKEGRTALEGAAEHGRIDMLQYLLNNGASIEGAGRDQCENAIDLAEKNGHLSASNLLKSHHRSLYGSP